MKPEDTAGQAGHDTNSRCPFDEVVARLTERLKGDPELRAEVENELKGHLEASAKEFVAAGRSEEEARGEAVRAMGDEKEVAEGLWQGNKKRITRRRVGRWVVGGTLVSAAGVGTAVVAWGALVSVAVALATMATLGSKETTTYFGDRVFRSVSDGVRASRVEAMSPDTRAVFDAGEGSHAERIERSAALAEQARNPEDRALFAAHYAVQTLLDHEAADGTVADWAKFERALEAMEAGKKAEPGNGFYALAEASLLLGASAVDVQLPDDGQPPAWLFEMRDEKGRAETQEFYDYKVNDPEMYARGLEQLREAARAKYVDPHVAEFTSRRLAAMGPGTRLADEYLKAREEAGVMMPYLNPARWAINVAGAHAIRLARQGKVAEALELVKAGQEASRKMVGSAGPLIELLVAAGMYDAALAQEAMVHRVAGDEAKFVEARGRLEELRRAMRLRQVTGRAAAAEHAYLKARAGALDGMFLWSGTQAAAALPGLTPGRRAEYAVADDVGVSVWVMVFVLAGVWPAAGAVWHRWSTGRWPVGVFVGWRRLARVVLWAVVVPLGIYALYAAVPVVGGRDLAVRVGWDRLLVEYTAVGCVIVILLRVIGGRVVAERARELGTVLDGDRIARPGRVMIGGVLAAAVVAYRVAWQVTARQAAWEGSAASMGVIAVLLSALLAAYAVGWWVRGWGGTKDWRKELPGWVAPVMALGVGVVLAAVLYGKYGYRSGQAIADVTSLIVPVVAVALLVVGATRAVRGRSSHAAAAVVTFGYGLTMAPVILAATIVLAAGGGGAARWAERRSVARMEALNRGGTRLNGEVERSTLATVREAILASQGSL